MKINQDLFLELTNPNYRVDTMAATLYHKYMVHSDGVIPQEILEDARPTEPSYVREHRIKTYEPVSQARWQKAEEIVLRIPNAKDWLERPRETTDADFWFIMMQPFRDESRPKQFMFDYAIFQMLKDPNGFIVAIPDNLFDKNRDNSNRLVANFHIVNSDHVLYHEANSLLFYKIDQDNFVYLDELKAIKFTRNKDKNGKEYFTNVSVEYPGGVLPFITLGGVKKNKDYLISFFHPMVPWLNYMAKFSSDFQAMILMRVTPEKIVVSDEKCPHCEHGVLYDEKTSKHSTCHYCNGTGMRIPSEGSPYQVYYYKRQDLQQSPVDAGGLIEPVKYISPPLDTAQFLAQIINDFANKAMQELGFHTLDEVPLNQSGLAKSFDLMQVNHLLSIIASRCTELIRWMYYTSATWYFNTSDRQKLTQQMPTVHNPQRFDLLSEEQMITELVTLQNSGGVISEELIKQMQISLAAAKFSEDPLQMNKVIDSIMLDGLAFKSSADISYGVERGIISEQELKLHYNIGSLLVYAYEQDPMWSTRTYEEKKAILISKLNETIDNGSDVRRQAD